MEEEYQEMDWDAVSYYCNHWQEGNLKMKAELSRIAKIAHDEAMKDVMVTMERTLDLLEVASYDETSFQQALKEHLQDHVSKMNRLTLSNPYLDLTDGYTLEILAERFVLANMTSTKPDGAIDWLLGVDASNERLRVLISALFHIEVKKQLLVLRKIGYDGIFGDDNKNLITTGNNESCTTSEENVVIKNSPESNTPNLFVVDHEINEPESSLEERDGKKRKALMKKIHGFPFSGPPLANTHRRIHQFLVDKELINKDKVKIADIASLFSEEGPEKHIQLLKEPGKLIWIIRWLAEQEVLAQADKGPPLVDFSEGELKRFGYWLIPRFIGTFRDSENNPYNTKVLSNSANRLPHEQLKETKWYKKMDEALSFAVFGKK